MTETDPHGAIKRYYGVTMAEAEKSDVYRDVTNDGVIKRALDVIADIKEHRVGRPYREKMQDALGQAETGDKANDAIGRAMGHAGLPRRTL